MAKLRMTGAQLQKAITDLATPLGWRFYFNPDSRRSPAGWPDLVLWQAKTGLCWFRELKGDGDTLSDIQTQTLDELRRCGLDADWWHADQWRSGEIERAMRGVR